MAAGYGYADIVKVLLARGADPYLMDAHGNNALTHAVNGVGDIDRFTLGSCQPETVRVLAKAPDLRAKGAWNTGFGHCPEVAALIRGAR